MRSIQSRVAVIILNWNGEKFLRDYLPSVVKFTPEEIADVFVTDNGSTDGSLGLLRSDFPTVKVISLDENHGFAEGYNISIRNLACSYKYSVLLNSDVAVKDDWLTPLYNFMVTHPEAGAVQPKIMSMLEPEKFEYAGAAGGFLDKNGFPYCRGRIFDTVETDRGQYDTTLQVDWSSGAALMVDNALYMAVGGLDKRFFAHMEEIDLCWRMRLAGRSVWAIPDSKVYHLGGGSLPASNPKKTYLNFRNNLLMLSKNLPPQVRRWRLIRRRLLDALAWCKFVASLDWENACAVFHAHRDYAKMVGLYGESAAQVDLIGDNVDILVEYYAKGHKKFSQLKNQNRPTQESNSVN
ncbi:MAG: glycosyltransferase family 2 protein [Muribaculum sp.]|nr:glycosyltransferase family 2 protein [Muribaculum sp.]